MILEKIKKVKGFIDFQRYKKGQVNFYKRILKPGSVCFDIGANNGVKTETFLKAGASKVIAIEPQPTCTEVIRNKNRKNRNVIVVQKAIADTIGTANISVCEDRNTISTMSDKWKSSERFKGVNTWQKTIEVQTTTIDELISTYGKPDFCKIDVEGFELAVLKGMSQSVPLLSFEFSLEFFEETQNCLEQLKKLNYSKFNFTLEDGTDFLIPEFSSAEILVAQIKKSAVFLSCGDIYARQ